LFQVLGQPDLPSLSPVADGEVVQWGREPLRNGVGCATLKDALDGAPKPNGIDLFMLPNEQKIDKISAPRRPTALVGSRVRVQLLGNLTLDWNDRHIDRPETELSEKAGTLRRLRIPRVRSGCGHVYL